MATVDGLTKDRMLAIEAESVTGARLDPATNHLILVKHDLSEIDVGDVQGPVGPQGPPGTPLHGTTVAGPANFGDASTPGVDTTHFSMADHDHGLPSVTPHTTVQSFLLNDVALVGGVPTELVEITLDPGTWLVIGRASGENTSGVDAIDLWLSTVFAGGQAAAIAAAVVNLMQIDNSWTPSFSAIVTPGVETTYYLNIESGGACTIKSAGTFITTKVVTGLVAVRLA